MFDINLNFWLILGFFGQFLFFMRFIIQWIHSERRSESIIPIQFWYFSIAGAIIIFIYAVHIKDIVFMSGQGLALMIYIRNLVLIKKVKNKESINKSNSN
jgi:lipid-A-disaccharide synthase-like uncharacterized protein|tara:strand:+ start:272 stop:571 length:300 start_codon:yes stop_codon:yes gene_type:complete